jgi:carbonic anhydrase
LESIKQSLANLRSFPCIRTLEERGKLKLHGAYFGVMDGRLLVYDGEADRFKAVAKELHAAALSAPRF